MPSVSILSKLHSLFEEILFHNIDLLLMQEEVRKSVYTKRRRQSLYHSTLNEKEERLRIEILTLLDGVGWPTASVILHFYHKELDQELQNNHPYLHKVELLPAK